MGGRGGGVTILAQISHAMKRYPGDLPGCAKFGKIRRELSGNIKLFPGRLDQARMSDIETYLLDSTRYAEFWKHIARFVKTRQDLPILQQL